MSPLPVERLRVDLLVVGGGTAGCAAAIAAKEVAAGARVLVLEKAHLDRSGCLAAGVNALNAYLRPGADPRAFVAWVREDSGGLVREDLVESVARLLPEIPPRLEAWGLPIPHAPDGGYLFRGPRSIVIQGEQLKPVLAARVREAGAEVLNRLVVTDYLTAGGRVAGACGFGLRDGVFYAVEAGAVLCATGGAAGLYPSPNGGPARHRTWYSPFNCGTGYALGLRAGAELTSLEKRFVPLRVKDVQAPTGTVAQGVKARQVNASGEEYLRQAATADRLARTLAEVEAGRGPCYLALPPLAPEEEKRLLEAYLAMCPEAVLYWVDRGVDPGAARLELAGGEPVLVGGHGPTGYWVDVDRRTTLPGLWAAGDAAGGALKKYVSGCLAEGRLAAEAALASLGAGPAGGEVSGGGGAAVERTIGLAQRRAAHPLETPGGIPPRTLEARLQKILEEYAGGASRGYRVSKGELRVAAQLLAEVREQAADLGARDLHELLAAHEVLDRLEVAEALVAHLLYDAEIRGETRGRCFVNSRREEDGTLALIERREPGPGGWAPWR